MHIVGNKSNNSNVAMFNEGHVDINVFFKYFMNGIAFYCAYTITCISS